MFLTIEDSSGTNLRQQPFRDSSTAPVGQIDDLIDLSAGDTVRIANGTSGDASYNLVDTGLNSYFSIHRLGDGSPLAALTDAVNARASGDPASATVGNPIIWPTSDFDTHAAYGTGTGLYTCPVSGTYRVSGYVTSPTATITLNIEKNGSTDIAGGVTDTNGEGVYSGLIKCDAGDTLSLSPSGTLDVVSGHMAIEKV